MCGIIGTASHKFNNYTEGFSATKVLHHRGPDNSKQLFFEKANVLLGHTRLSIIDLTDTGNQPMEDQSGRFVITYNGEIYNYKDIAKELEKEGYSFKSRSDTEVILNSYKQWGAKCLNKLNGMFAFVIYDKGDYNHSPSFFIARDRVGKKPFYYLHRGKEFIFASELKGIKSLIPTPFKFNYRALNYYLALGYIPNDLCIAEGIKKLPPAHAGIFDIQSGKLKIWRYWTLPLYNNVQIQNKEELLNELEYLFRDAVRLRLISDVPVGVLLSGGVDSSIIAAVAAQESSVRIKTFNVGFPGERNYDESMYARIIAEQFDTEHYELPAPDTGFLGMLEDIKSFVDEPIGDSSILPTFLISRLTRKHVKTALGGDGGDELFGGYPHYQRALKYNKYFKGIPNFVWNKAYKIASKLPVGVRGRNRLISLKEGPWGMQIWGTPYFDYISRKKLLNGEILKEIGEYLVEPERWLKHLRDISGSSLNSLMQQDFQSYLPDDILAKVDRASMMNSLEIRAPWLDYRLVEWVFLKVHETWKVTRNHRRRLQKELGKKILPKDFNLDRKQGFSLPLDKYLKKMNWEDLNPFLTPLKGIIDFNFIHMLWNGQRKGRMNTSRLFCLIMLGVSRSNL